MIRNIIIVLLCIVHLNVGAESFGKEECQKQKDVLDTETIKAQIEAQLGYACKLANSVKSNKEFLPRYAENGKVRYVSASDWTSGFFPGTLWYLYELTGKKKWKGKALWYTLKLKDQQFNTSTHDVGFIMFCSYGNALRLTGNNDFKKIIYQTSKSLLSRFNTKVGCIRSWDHHADIWQFPVIIDNMMNLEMLCQTSKFTGDKSFEKIAKIHANTTMKNHFRDDYSTFHVVDYNPENGGINEQVTNQGYADGSAWARGQAWGLYGYTMMFRETGDKSYLRQAEKIANFVLNHPNMPMDRVPYWDFKAPDIPNAPRDASAAAIIASALFELEKYSDNKEQYHNIALQIMKSLCSETYFAEANTNNGFLLKHSTGNMPMDSEIDVPIIYADYYFLEAFLRMINLEKQ